MRYNCIKRRETEREAVRGKEGRYKEVEWDTRKMEEVQRHGSHLRSSCDEMKRDREEREGGGR